ncbi:hypothetical protein GCM10010503_16600 [Streptomyces lucensis JCM 4490]|uniref:Beta-lactamase-related domain-containing protein n=1 Tax=Streptomyces lucensis JCM 4490 TaxID=1306176 RepID=A0A918J3G2_9ACTN|nr:hypothetical protein GCM10010503_16600 [Streptomyces lucensis JCM 4490]
MRKPRAGARRAAAAVGCAALLVSGWAAPCGAHATARFPVPAARAAVAFDPAPEALRRIDPAALRSAVAGAAKKLLVPGAVVLLRTPQGTFRVTVGTTERARTVPPTTDDHFRIASNTKTMTGALILLLAQDGRLRLSDPVSAYVPGVPGGAHITLAELLKMRSGLYDYTSAPELAASLDARPRAARTPREMLGIAFRRPPDFAPGTAYE